MARKREPPAQPLDSAQPLDPAPPLDATAALDELAGVGPKRSATLAKLGLASLRDLLLYAPRALEPAPRRLAIAEVARERAGTTVEVAGSLCALRLVRAGRGRSVVRGTLEDASGKLEALWFQQPWRRRQLSVGQQLVLRGKLVQSAPPALVVPRVGTEQKPLPPAPPLAPVYAVGAGLGQDFFRALIAQARARLAAPLEDALPADWLAERGLPTLAAAVGALHEPIDAASCSAARRRLALEALLGFQARLVARARARAGRSAPRLAWSEADERAFWAALPFEATRGQRELAEVLRAELALARPLRRLLQGDVGSGKTLLAWYALALCARSGAQGALLAPTELLAEQHARSARPLFAKLGLELDWISAGRPRAERERAQARLARGELALAIGTHALLGPELGFARLGLAIVDEQQRFGVGQRRGLLDKGADAHLLLTTATPIPRTLALALYGDLELLTLREAPPGRGRRRTRFVEAHELARMQAWLAERLASGERAYWVLPRIDSGPGGRGAEQAFAELGAGPLGAYGAALVHGRQPGPERERALERFRGGAARLLVATSVIEVGLDVPEASLLVVEGAERFGLAQLHQLRGRIGRGPRDAWCLLLAAPAARARLAALPSCEDGFAIAEADLAERGMGDLAGLRQSGANREGLAHPEASLELLALARELVTRDEALCARYLAAAECVSA